MSGRLVAAMRITPVLASKPSISTSSWLSVCSRSSWPPPRPAPRWRPTASISSTNTMAGAASLACLNRSRTRLAPTPTNISTKSEPGDREERHARLAGHGPRQQRLAGAGRAVEEHALGDPGAHGLEAVGVAQELLDLPQLLDGLVEAGDVGERDLGLAAVVPLGARPPELHDLPAARLGRRDEPQEDADHQQEGPDVEQHLEPQRRLLEVGLDRHLAAPQLVDHLGLVAGGEGDLVAATVGETADHLVAGVLHGGGAHLVGVDAGEELVEAQLGDVRAGLPRLVEQHEREAHHDQGQGQLARREPTAAGRGRAFR